jgi:hypothetical protein
VEDNENDPNSECLVSGDDEMSDVNVGASVDYCLEVQSYLLSELLEPESMPQKEGMWETLFELVVKLPFPVGKEQHDSTKSTDVHPRPNRRQVPWAVRSARLEKSTRCGARSRLQLK